MTALSDQFITLAAGLGDRMADLMGMVSPILGVVFAISALGMTLGALRKFLP